jgi:predicted RNase H-like nuclease (RuvC/YqgF family)
MKDKLQAELLEKVKEGIKPSDLKRPRKNIKPQVDEGYESDSSNKSIPVAPPLPNSQIKNLQTQIKALQRQLQVYQDFKEADLKIKEKLKGELAQQEEIIAKYSQAETEAEKVLNQQKKTIAELQTKNQELNKTIQELKNTAKTTAHANDTNNKEPIEKQESLKTFTCAECQQTKTQDQLSRVFGKFSFCLDCSKKARQTATQQKQEHQPQEFICHLCNKPKTEVATLMKLDSTLTEYQVCLECKPLAKEFNEADLITDEL